MAIEIDAKFLTKLISIAGIDLNVRKVVQGQRYGLDWRLTHDKTEPLIEIYDARYIGKDNPLGSFLSRYYETTLLKSKGGLCVDGGFRQYDIDDAQMNGLREWTKSIGSEGIADTINIRADRPKG